MTDKTHFADDATLAYIAQIEKELAAANARLAGIVEAICGDMEMRLSERQRSRIRALAPAVAEKVNAESALSECKECEEQVRLNGMGSEREARLMAQLSELREKHDRLVARLREPSEKMLEAMRRVIYHSKDTLTKAITAMSTVALRDSEGGE